MIPLVLSRAVFLKRGMLQKSVIKLNELLDGHELRSLIIFSLICQVILVFLGDHRKYSPKVRIRALTWSAYLMADSVASYALGMITNTVALIDNENENENASTYPIENITMTLFWAPFLLLHLGGPDRITAFSLEDNELWSRHLFSLFNQMIAIVIVFSIAWDESRFYKLSMLMMVPALIKYGERVWVLWAASSDHFKNFVPDLQPDHSRIMEEYKLKEIEGHKLIQLTVNKVHKVMRTHVEADLKSLEEQPSSEKLYRQSQFELLAARGLVDIFKRIFADLLLSFDEYATSWSVLKGKNFLVVFRVIEFELGFLYDLLYTKALVIYSRVGLFLCFLSISVILVVLILFTFTHKNQLFSSSMFDINLSYALVVVALLLEIYALYGLLLSDWTACWLINHKWFGFMKLINWFRPLHKRRRWSNQIGQYNLLSVSLKEKQSSVCHRVLGFLLGVDKMPVVQKHLYKTHEDVNDHLKEFIFKQLARDDQRRDAELPSPWSKICYHFRNSNSLDNPGDSHDEGTESRRTISKCLSRYMAYLLVMHPSLLPSGTRRIKYQDTYATGMRFFEQHTKDKRHKIKMTEACDLLLRQVENEEKHTIPKGQTSKLLWYNGCLLASKLHDIANEKKRWTAVSEVWVEMFAYAASKCDASDHAQQLRRGRGLLTHVWFLMTHFGLTDYFKIQNVPAIADMIVK
ncbi:hypothetical protein BT93_E2364 [Corymbia citriodora subsp. variegata]|nr:hypothetical protein BT93_E2364 [Corymbia citriodora subsp. variegata]